MKVLNCQARKSKKTRTCRLSWRFINGFLLVCLFIVGVAYLGIVNDLTVKSFAVRDLRLEAANLSAEYRELETTLMANKSYNKLAERLTDLSMVEVDDFEYIILNNDTTVAKR